MIGALVFATALASPAHAGDKPFARDRRFGATVDYSMGGEALSGTTFTTVQLEPSAGVTPWFAWCPGGSSFCYGPSLGIRGLAGAGATTTMLAPALRGTIGLQPDGPSGLGFQFVVDLGVAFTTGGTASFTALYGGVFADGRYWFSGNWSLVVGVGGGGSANRTMLQAPILHAGIEHAFF